MRKKTLAKTPASISFSRYAGGIENFNKVIKNFLFFLLNKLANLLDIKLLNLCNS